MGDEYLIVPAFFAGTVVQGMLVARSWSGAGGTLAFAAATLGFAWIGARQDEDAAFAVPFMGLFFFVIVLGYRFRDRLLPRLSSSVLLHYTLLSIYALYVVAAGRPVPWWFHTPFAVAAVLGLHLGLSGREPGRFTRVLTYACFLLAITFLIGWQLSPTHLEALYDDVGFSIALYSYVFSSGMVFLYFATSLLALMLLVLGTKRDEISRGHAGLLAGKVEGTKLSSVSGALILAHGAALWANLRFQYVMPGLYVNVALATLAALSHPETESPRRAQPS
ncbi:MAG: hypothetical protein BMS9Abin37_1490 [Acidobacteriota bacterium]|nr:MAG: hypothetical protein BMS9Abin37_1490 [Acidobacteriota bacterium]